MNGIWAKDYIKDYNITLGFFLDLKSVKEFDLSLVAGTVYKIYVDANFKFFGPCRSAHGYCRRHNLKLKGEKILILVNHPGIKSYCYVKEDAYFNCNIKTSDGLIYTEDDFICFKENDRSVISLRYSYQRCFSELYDFPNDVKKYFENDLNSIEVIKVDLPKILEKKTNDPLFNIVFPEKIIEEGFIEKSNNNVLINPRFFTLVGGLLDGYETKDIKNNQVNEYYSLVHATKKSDIVYKIYKFDGSITGFINLKVNAKQSGIIYLAYEEMISKDDLGKYSFNPLRNETVNIVKWNIDKAGVYSLSTFEPYTAQYVQVINPATYDIELSITEYVNPDCDNLIFETSDDDLNLIIESARNTLKANAVDLLTDCPSRERSGWLSDSYFSSVAERVFTGKNLVEEAFLENYAYSYQENIPPLMVPSNYPSDSYDGCYIPNWSMWYILEVCRYIKRYKSSSILEISRPKIFGLIEFFKHYENEYNLLENLESWVFVEWSQANDASHIKGVNIPSNMCYAHVLEEVGLTFNDESLITKSKIMKENIIKLGFNGTLFVDNLIRNEDNDLIPTKNFTEVCQYYAFWFNTIDKVEFSGLYDLLINKLGPNKKDGFMTEVTKPNMMYGIYMRLDLLMRDLKQEQILDEIKYYFLKMAKTTKTLWEHTGDGCSLCHAFAAYSIKWIIFGVTGINVETDIKECVESKNISYIYKYR